MNDRDKKKIQIIVVVSALLLVIAITLVFNNPFGGSSSGSGSRGPVQMSCGECNAQFQLTMDEFREQMLEKQARAMGQAAFVCTECGKEAAYRVTTGNLEE